MKTRKSLFMSVLALVFCVALLIGTTFAWFTDAVESTGNKIQAGTLKLDLLVLGEDDGKWKSIKDSQEPVFNYQKWEPGYTDVTIFKVVNLGSLSLKWQARFASTKQLSKLAEVIDVYVCPGIAESYPTSRELDATWKHVGTLDQFANTLSSTTYGFLDAQESATLGIALKMQESAGNEYQDLTLGEFDIRIVATQRTAEDDSFDNLYDEDAMWPGDISFETIASLDRGQVVHGALASDFIIRYSDSVYARLPAGVIVADDAESIAFSGKSVENGSITFGEGDNAKSYDIHIEGISEENKTPITVYLGAIFPKNLGNTSLKLYHEDTPMTRVNSVADFAINNQYTYDPATGEVVLYVDNFSVFSAVQTEADVWDGKSDTTWYNESDTEFTLTTAKQFAGFRDLVDGGNTFEGKTVTLGVDIDLDNKPFDPIGFGYYNAETNTRVFMGTFDGGNHTIYNLYQNCWELDPDKESYSTYTYSTAGAGLFASIKDATIKNLAISGAEIVFECVDMGVVVGYAQGTCHFENIVVTNSQIANYNRYTGGLVGEVSYGPYGIDTTLGYSHTFKNITIDSSVTVSGLWGSFGCGMGGVIGGKWGDATVKMENVVSAPVMDVYNDVVSAYQWYAFRGCGMLIGHTEEPYSDGRHAGNATASFLTCENVKVYYGDWTEYTYYRFSNQTDNADNRLWYSDYPWVRAEAGKYCDAFSNIRYGIPQIRGVKVTEFDDKTAEELSDARVVIIFDQLYGADRGMYGTAEHAGVTVFKKNVKTIYIKNNLDWTELKLDYWYKHEEDTWTNLLEPVKIELIEGESDLYKVVVSAYADSMKITSAESEEGTTFEVPTLFDGAIYNLNGEHIHDYQWVVDKAPTHELDGIKHEECTGCHGLRNVDTPIAKLTCTLTKVDAKDATCEEVGNEEYYKCDNCDKVYSDEKGYFEIHEMDYEIPAHGHKINADGICDYCGLGTITFQSGKTSNPIEIAPAIVAYKGEVISSLPTPTLSNHTFGGWYLDNACTVPFNEGSTFSASLTLYAKWTPTNVSTTPPITILSYHANTSGWYSNTGPYIGAFEDAGTLLGDGKTKVYPDIICLQNASDEFRKNVNFSSYGYAVSIQNARHTGVTVGDKKGYTLIFYKADKFTANIGSGFDDYHSYIVLERKTDGAKVVLVNAWFDNTNEANQNAQLNAMWSRVNGIWKDTKKYGHMPIIITGSIGAAPTDSNVYQSLTENSLFVDASKVAKSSTGANSAIPGDYVLVSHHMQYAVESYNTLEKRNTNYPIVVEVALPDVCSSDTGGHLPTKTEAKTATCLEAGNREYYTCFVCGKVYADEQCTIETTVADCEIPAFGHKAGLAPTCETAQTCIRCGEELAAALGHAWTHVCDIDCNNSCGATRDKIHDYQWVVDIPPTHSTAGVKHEVCTICQQERNKNTPIDMLTCDLDLLTKVEAKDPTCEEAGNTEYYICSNCNKVYSNEECSLETTIEKCTIPALGHNVNDAGICTVCEKDFNRTISFQNGNAYTGSDAKLPASISGIVGEELPTISTPVLNCYDFKGWYRDSDCTDPFKETTFSDNLTLYAKWVQNTTESQMLTILSLNINGGNSANSFISNLISGNAKPDIICLQEAGAYWMKEDGNANSILSGYSGARWNVNGHTGENSGLANVIFYKTGDFTPISSNTRWVSNAAGSVYSYTDENGTTYTENTARYVHYFVIQRNADKALFAIVNIQFDDDGAHSPEVAEKIRQAEANYVMTQIQGVWDGRGIMPIIVTGDFNSTSDGTAYNSMTQTFGFFDASKIAGESTIKNTNTANGSVQDYIFVSNHLMHAVESYSVSENTGSDHNALIVELILPDLYCGTNPNNNNAPSGHMLTKTEAVAATCITAGSKEYYTCSICEKVFTDVRATTEITVEDCVIPPLGHEAGAAATCTDSQTCVRCAYEFAAPIGHAWTNACDTDCNNSCGAIREIIHDYQWVVDTNPTFNAEGVKHEECAVCHETRNENTSIEKLTCNHELIKTEAVAATCSTKGNREYYTCSLCQKVYLDENGYLETTVADCKTPVIPHTWVEATCTAPKTCSVCGETEGTPLDHVLDSNGVCALCGKDFVGTITFKGGKLPYGTYSGDNVNIVSAISGEVGETISLPTPQMDNHTFMGWYRDYTCTQPFTETTFSEENLTLYAKWEPKTQDLKIMSFNVRVASWTEYLYNSRADLVISIIQTNDPDVLCVQEADPSWMSTLNRELANLGYTAVSQNKGRDGGGSGEHTAIFYKTDKFTAKASGTKWLSNTPDVEGSKYSYKDANGTTHTSNYPRIMTYVVLERKSDGGSFLVVNTHLDNNGDNAHNVAEVIRAAEVDIMMNIIKGITDARGDLPIIITGDFNVIPTNRSAYNAMTQTYEYLDSRIIKKAGDSPNTHTYNGMKDDGGSILDYIFVTRHMQGGVKEYGVCSSKINGEWASDHNAIYAVISVPYVKRTY